MKTSTLMLSVALIAAVVAIHLRRREATQPHAGVTAAATPSVPAVPILPGAGVPPDSPTAAPTATMVNAPATIGRSEAQMTERLLAMLRRDYRTQLTISHPDVGEALELSAREMDQLFDVLARQFSDMVFASAGVAESDRVQALARRLEANHVELVALLGNKYPKWQSYSAELPARWQLKELDAALAPAGMPLTSAQVDSLVPMLTAAHDLNRQQRLAQPEQTDPGANRRLLEAAASYLSPQQLESFRQLLERHSRRESPPLNAVQRAQRQLIDAWSAR